MESVSGRAQKWSQAMCLDPWDSFCFTKPSRRTVALNMKRDTMQPVTLTLQSLTAQEGFHNVTRYTKTEDNWFFPKHVNIQASKKQTGCAPVHGGILSPASYTWWWALTHISQAARGYSPRSRKESDTTEHTHRVVYTGSTKDWGTHFSSGKPSSVFFNNN